MPARPAMAAFTNITRPHWVADGGLLDNQPIDVLLKRIFDRPARRPVRRVLLFVVPSSGPAPDLVQEAPPDNVNEPLGLVDGLLKDLAAITTQSIAADLRAIRAHQDRMEARTDTRLRLAELAATLPEGSRLLTTSLLTDYTSRGGNQTGSSPHQCSAAPAQHLATGPSSQPKAFRSTGKTNSRSVATSRTMCRRQVTTSILQSLVAAGPRPAAPQGCRSRTCPVWPTGLDLAKGCALAIVQAAYRAGKVRRRYRCRGRNSPKESTGPANRPNRLDFGESFAQVCTDPAVRARVTRERRRPARCRTISTNPR